jgi:hypothetical protein
VTHVNERSYRVALEIHIEHEGLQVHVERPCRRWQPQLSNSRRGSRGCIKKSHTRVHMGVVFQICVEKDSETEKPEHLRKYKGRVVFRGNDVVEENWDIALFRELGSAPATMVAAKTCDLYGLLRVMSLKMRMPRKHILSRYWGAPTLGFLFQRGVASCLATRATSCLSIGESIVWTSRCRRALGAAL